MSPAQMSSKPPCPHWSQVPVPPRNQSRIWVGHIPLNVSHPGGDTQQLIKFNISDSKLVSWQAEILRVNFRAKQLEHTGRSGQAPWGCLQTGERRPHHSSASLAYCFVPTVPSIWSLTHFTIPLRTIATILQMRKQGPRDEGTGGGTAGIWE